ncbi:uncharacterized protein TNIN_243741 [Trichonephila inaurata madagascariensis]|uniref:Uncharacterized protein n=1 Tax=Trichonephila inaurata madagascariensis TaxID=2747483 RepID=A0A8X7CAN6_9ARAC|nr:uncharacterized protein TNIN_243741 [Trichonephila inaurata madagascariensis]
MVSDLSVRGNPAPRRPTSRVKCAEKRRDSGFTRKPSLVASDCINLKNFLGLTRQRSEINLSNLGLIGNDSRRSRSEVRGISCDRLTIGYHTPSATVAANPQAGNASPPNKSGCWLRGRKKEREVRCPLKISADVIGKTIVTGSSKRASSKPCETRTVADQSGGSKSKKPSIKNSDTRKGKSNKKGSNENLLEEDIYAEIGHICPPKEKLLKENKTAVKGPVKASRKKGQAPKPQVANLNIKDSNYDVNLNPNGLERKDSSNCFNEKKNSPQIKPSRRVQSGMGKIDEKQSDNRITPTVKPNNLKNSESFLTVKNKINSDSVSQVTVAEVHKNMENDCTVEKKKNSGDIPDNSSAEVKQPSDTQEYNIKASSNSDYQEFTKEKERMEEIEIEIPPYRIDTPDYSTLESVVDKNQKDELPDKSIPVKKEDTSPDKEDLNSTINGLSSETLKLAIESTISSILRDSSGDSKYAEIELAPKKMVRFEKLDLIETYKKNKAESVKDSDEDSIISVSDKKNPTKKLLDVNSNEIPTYELGKVKLSPIDSTETDVSEKLTCSSSDCLSEASSSSFAETECSQKDMTVNVLIRNPSPDLQPSNNVDDSQTDETQAQLVVKKSIVLTVAKQEKGFKSLCANKKPETVPEPPPPKSDHKISVTFLCSDPPEPPPYALKPKVVTKDGTVCLQSISVPPQNHVKIEVPPPLPPPMRGRSKERRSKDRQHCKKNHKSRKKNKEDAFHMPQAVIDELSQVLEKRKPSLDKKTSMHAA